MHGDVWARQRGAAAGADEPGHADRLGDWRARAGRCLISATACWSATSTRRCPTLDPEAWLIAPDEDRIAAVARSYAGVRTVSAAERELLPDAVRFTAAVVGAIHLELALSDGVAGPTMDARLARLENRLGVADEVAALAVPYLS